MQPIGTPVPFGFTATDPNIEAVGFSIGSTLGSANEWALAPNPVIHLIVNSVMDYDDPLLVNPDIVGRSITLFKILNYTFSFTLGKCC